jgi:uncharacterized protein YciI
MLTAMTLFVLVSRYVDRDAAQEHRDAHVAHVQAFHDRRWALASGPLVDGSGGVIVMRAPDRETLDAEFFARDPFALSGAVEYTVKEFTPAPLPRRSQELEQFLASALVDEA